jgi:hypothetical protein
MCVIAPYTQLGLQCSTERRWRLGLHMVACRHVLIVPLISPLIFIEHANMLYYHRLISTLIWLGSNPYNLNLNYYNYLLDIPPTTLQPSFNYVTAAPTTLQPSFNYVTAAAPRVVVYHLVSEGKRSAKAAAQYHRRVTVHLWRRCRRSVKDGSFQSWFAQSCTRRA